MREREKVMCKHEYAKGFKFCPYCGEELPQGDNRKNQPTHTRTDEWGAVRVDYYENPIITLLSDKEINDNYCRAIQNYDYLHKHEMANFFHALLNVCDTIEYTSIETHGNTDFFCYHDLNTSVDVEQLKAAGIIYLVGDIHFGKIIDQWNQTFNDKVKLYAYNRNAKYDILSRIRYLIENLKNEVKHLEQLADDLQSVLDEH